MSISLNGKAGVVTGASSGIGREIALALGQAGMTQWLVGRSSSELEVTAAMIAEKGGGPTHCVPMDLAEPGALARLVQSIGKEHDHLFALVNNAGIMHPEPILSADPAQWRAMFDVNVLAPLEAIRAAVDLMRHQGKAGHIINVSSLAARFDAGGVYGASKIALDMISRSLRQELEHDDIRVTSIVPGGFSTNLGRSFAPESMARMAAAAADKGIDLSGPDAARLFGDPAKIAETVLFILEQPIELNFQEIVIRPAVSLEL
ncbi:MULTISPECIES: SDR family oxidoreductase [Sphingobium]|uniref:SDR family oxidoreductase n=1 Tax=Sphingobium sp. MI1205 TaxID=407020 RepID=UPI00076FE91A|nr:SDR family oxidoreductase [Sphingobium sp. MI1205]AMK16861.1 short-chain dehydrogenase/reductase SDR [Sphingobium sp. MI1205]